MRLHVGGSLLALFVLVVPRSSALYEESLTIANFDKTLAKPGLHAAFLKFWAPWCGHCKQMEPYWVDLGEEYQDEESLLIGSIDCDDPSSSPICNRYKVSGFPTLLYLMPPDPTPDAYHGERGSTELRAFARELYSLCYPSQKRSDCTDHFRMALEEMERRGLDNVTADFKETRKHMYATELERRRAVDAMNSRDERVTEEIAELLL